MTASCQRVTKVTRQTESVISRDKGAGKEEYDKKMAAGDAIERTRAAPREEKGGEAWS